MIFDENGVRIDGKDNTSVQKAISDYLANLKFNGEFILAELVDILQGIEGCADRRFTSIMLQLIILIRQHISP